MGVLFLNVCSSKEGSSRRLSLQQLRGEPDQTVRDAPEEKERWRRLELRDEDRGKKKRAEPVMDGVAVSLRFSCLS